MTVSKGVQPLKEMIETCMPTKKTTNIQLLASAADMNVALHLETWNIWEMLQSLMHDCEAISNIYIVVNNL